SAPPLLSRIASMATVEETIQSMPYTPPDPSIHQFYHHPNVDPPLPKPLTERLTIWPALHPVLDDDIPSCPTPSSQIIDLDISKEEMDEITIGCDDEPVASGSDYNGTMVMEDFDNDYEIDVDIPENCWEGQVLSYSAHSSID